MAEIRGLSAFTIVGHLEWLVRADENLDLSHVPPPPERVSEIEAAFKSTGGNLLPPVRDADRIVVLESGRVAQEGTHQQLLANGGPYAQLVSSQLVTAPPREPDGG